MAEEIELINDGDGVAVLGEPRAVDAFLRSRGLESSASEFSLGGRAAGKAAGLVNAGAVASATSGKWLRLTDESAAAMKVMPMVKNSTTGNLHAILRSQDGKFAKNLQFVATSPVALTNPATLAMAAAMMSQQALQASIDEILDYLEVIDEKVDDVLRAQKDEVFADMIGVDILISEAMTVRDEVGRVSDVTWSKLETTTLVIARTQGYALRRIDALAEKMEKASVKEVAAVAKTVEPQVREWLAVIARCVQLHDAIAVLELDRVLDSSPEEILAHRRGLDAARVTRLATIHRSTELLLDRMNDVARRANAKVLLTPLPARSALSASNTIAGEVISFQAALGTEDGHESITAKRWRAAVGEAKDKALKTGAEGAQAMQQLGGAAAGKARSGAGRLSAGAKAFSRAVRQPQDGDAGDEPTQDAAVIPRQDAP